jgi:hypothetical protein
MIAGAATLAPGLAKGGAADPPVMPLVNPEKPMPDNVTADEIRTLLKLEPNATCDFVRETYKSDLSMVGCLRRSRNAGRSARRSISW